MLRSASVSRFRASPLAGVFSGAEGIVSPLQLPGVEAWYDVSDLSSMRNDAGAIPSNGEGVKLISDKSGNSSVNVLCLNGSATNYASFTALTAFGTGDFSFSFKIQVNQIAGGNRVCSGAANAADLFITTGGAIQIGKATVGAGTASTGTISAFQTCVIAYVRSGTTGTYYIDGVSAGTTTDSNNYTVGQSVMGIFANTPSANPFNGIYFWGRVYSSALTGPQVAADAAGTVQSNCVFNANFATAAKLAPSFTESSSNAATVTINTSGATGARISGARDLVQMTAANQPILTISASGNFLTFDGSNDYLKAAAFALAQPETVYFVGSQVTWTINDTIFDGNASLSGALVQDVATPQITAYAGTNIGFSSGWAVGANAVISTVFNGASSLFRVNRTTAVTGAGGAANMQGFTLGGRGTFSNGANITASEVVLRSVADGTPVQDSLILYLGRKWGIAV